MEWLVFKVFTAYALGIIALWAITTKAATAMLKSRPKLDTSKRQRKLYVHTIQPKGE